MAAMAEAIILRNASLCDAPQDEVWQLGQPSQSLTVRSAATPRVSNHAAVN